MEIERKFLIDELPKDLNKYPYYQIEQGYLCQEPVVRIRRQDNEYYLTYKSKGLLAREEHNLLLTKESYKHLKTKIDGLLIKKKRYNIPYNKFTIELDIFLDDLAPLIIAEVEFSSIEESENFVIPNWFVKDVTLLKEYQNNNLAMRKNK